MCGDTEHCSCSFGVCFTRFNFVYTFPAWLFPPHPSVLVAFANHHQDGSFWCLPWLFRLLLLDTRSCHGQGEEGGGGEGGGLIACVCVCVEFTTDLFSSYANGKSLPSGASGVFLCNCRILYCHWYRTSVLVRQSPMMKKFAPLMHLFSTMHSVCHWIDVISMSFEK